MSTQKSEKSEKSEKLEDSSDSDDDRYSIAYSSTSLISRDEHRKEVILLESEPTKHRSFTTVMETMNTKFSYQDGKLSTALDVISWYLKGQKMIYLEAQSYCEFYLYRLMIPAICISTITSVISGIFTGNVIASNVVSGATALNTLILSLINYFKLDAKAEAHKMTAYSFDQLISDCEFTSGKILLNNMAHKSETDVTSSIKKYDQVFFQEYMCKIEEKIKEIKEKNQFIIPSTIRERYPTVCNCNIFMDVLKKHIHEMQQCNELKVLYNQEIDIENQLLLEPDNKILKTMKGDIYAKRNNKICSIMNDRIDDTNYSKCVLNELHTQRKRKSWFIY